MNSRNPFWGVEAVAGERLTFIVDSDSGQRSYRVDLEANHNNGQCDCPNFRFKRAVKLRESGGTARLGSMCKHIKRTFAWFGWEMAHKVSEQLKSNVPDTGP